MFGFRNVTYVLNPSRPAIWEIPANFFLAPQHDIFLKDSSTSRFKSRQFMFRSYFRARGVGISPKLLGYKFRRKYILESNGTGTRGLLLPALALIPVPFLLPTKCTLLFRFSP